MTTPRLARLIERGRGIGVRDDHARTYVGELARWARVEPVPRRRWWPWLGGLAAAVAAIVAVILWSRTPVRSTPIQATSEHVVWLGDRVAIIAQPGTRYRVVTTDDSHTEVAIDHGTVTARLFPGSRRHQLALRGGGLEARATGTVYSLTVDDSGAFVAVHEGKVEVDDSTTTRTIAAGTTWPPSRPTNTAAASELVEIPTPPAPEVVPPRDAGTNADAAVETETAAPRPPYDAAPAVMSMVPTPPSLADRWHTARLYRSQARFDDAVAECLTIADAHDATWSPIALIEVARIELGPRADPEQAILFVDRLDREWPGNALAPEAHALRCRASRQVGRSCGPPDAGP